MSGSPRTRVMRVLFAASLAGLTAMSIAVPLPSAAAATVTNLGALPLTAPAAGVAVGKLAAVAAPAGRVVGSFALGSFKRLQVRRFVWNNSNSDAYQVGIVPSASSGYPCSFAVVRTWHVRTSAGQRRLYFEVRGEGNDGCTAEAVLVGLSATRTWTTGSLPVGASKSFRWNNANPLSDTYTVGLVPGANSCELEVTRMLWRRLTDGEREFAFTVRNIGSVTCAADAMLVQTPASNSRSWGGGYKIGAGIEMGAAWDGDMVIVGGLTPAVNPSGTCTFDLVEYSYMRGPDYPDGRRSITASFTFRNASAIACATQVSASYVT